MNELFRTFNPHEKTAQAAREWNQEPSYEDFFRPQLNEGIATLPDFQEEALGGGPYDQYQRTSMDDPSTWTDAARSRDFLIGLARHHGTAQDLKKVESWPYTPPEVLGYLHPFDQGGFNPELIGELYGPWSGSGVVPRITGPPTWDDEENFKVGVDVNLGDPFGWGGEALIDYNVSPSSARDMRPFQGESPRDITLKYVKRFGDE